MKTLLHTLTLSVLLILGFCAAGSRALAAVGLPYHDAFNYSEGNLNAVAGGNWAVGNGSSTFEIAVSNAAALTAPASFPASSGKGVRRSPSGTARRSVLTFPAIAAADGNVLYASFLIEVAAAPGSAQILLHADNSSGSVTSPDMAFFLDSGPKIGIGKNASAAGFVMATNLGPGVHLVVGRYTFQSGNDLVELWVDPAASYYGAGTAPAPLGSHSNSGDPTSIGYCQIITASGASGGVQYLDEYRIGTTWAEVVPSGGPVVGEKLGFTTQPANAAPGATMAPVVVQVQSASGAAVASNGVPVTLSLTSGSGSLSGTLTQNTDAAGQATFSDLSIDTAGIKQLTAAASGIGAGLSNAVSATFSMIAAPVGVKLAFTTQPADGVVNTTLSGVIVQIQDTGGLAVASNGVSITLALSSGSGNLIGTLTRNTDGTGKAIFNDLSLDTAGTGKQLTASAAGGIGAGLADAVSNPFNITLTPVGVRLAFTTQPASAPANAPINDIMVQIQDNQNAAVASNGVPITLALTLGSGTLSGTTTQNTDGTGKATFSSLSIDLPGAAKQLTASASGIGAGLASAPSAIFAITAPPVTGPPVITQAVMNAASFILRGTNGAPGGEYRVLIAANVAQPMVDWTSVLTNHFNGSGGFDCTNAVPPSSSQGFFRLLSLSGGGNLPDFGHYGFAGVDSSGNVYGLTGGTNGSSPQDNIVTVSNFAQLESALANTAPLIIQVAGEIYMRTNGNFYVQPNKTIIGLGTNATLVGCLGLYGNAPGGLAYACSNIIIRNLTLRNPDQFGEDDGIAIKYGAHHIWVDHCTIHDVYDGALDITRESDFVSVSWCKFYYTSVNSHGDTVDLVGGSDDDTTDLGKLHVTFHHNWWGALCRERIPSVRFGRAHVYNNYYNCAGNHYCTRARLYSEVLVENNYFDNVYNPWELATSSQGPDGKLRAVGNITNNCTFSTTHYDPNLPNGGVVVLVPGDDTLSSGVNQLNPPPYTCPLDEALTVPTLVQTHAGAGKGPFAP